MKTIAQLTAERYREELDHLLEEYEFMRSFGMSHERACERIEQDPDQFRARARRNGITL